MACQTRCNVLLVLHVTDTGTAEIINKAKELAEQLNIEADFPVKRAPKKKRLVSESVDDKSHKLTAEQKFDKELKAVLDNILSDLSWRYQQMNQVASDFMFLFGKELQSKSVEVLQQHAADLALKYYHDLNATDLVSEIETFKFQATSLLQDIEKVTPLQLLNFIHEYSLQGVYPNIEIALRLFLTLPVTVASCERSFSKLKIVKNYLRSSMGQERLSGLSIISIEYGIATKINYDDAVNDFALAKARKVHFM